MSKQHLYRATALLLFVSSFSAKAQLVSSDIFLQGSYVEVGIAPNGAFGSGNAAPTGYHPKGSTGVGFVADPDKDGWTVGTPAYFGDYFLPGTPQEGWGISVDGNDYAAWRGTGATAFTPGLTGSNTSYTSSGGNVIGVWTGTVGNLKIIQTTTLQTNKLYFVVNVEIQNTGTATAKNLYYNRTVDPDNEVTLTGDFETVNKIVYRLPTSASNKTLVTATGKTYTNAYLGLGTKDCRAKPFIVSGSLVPTTNNAALYSGTGAASGYTYDETTVTNDVGIGIVFKLDSLAAGASTSVAYAYILRQTDLDSAFLDITPRWRYNGVSYNSGDTIRPCKGSVIDLKIDNGGYYDSWSWSPTTGVGSPSSSASKVTVGTSPLWYTATGTSSVCSGTSIAASIYINPVDAPTAPTVSSPVNLCRGQTTTALTASPSGGLKWYSSATDTTALSSAPVPSTGTEGTVSYYVATNNGVCEGPRSRIDVVVKKYPNPVVVSPQNFCTGNDTITVSGVTGTNLKWYNTASGGMGTSVTPVVSRTSSGNYKFYVSQSSSIPGCESDRDSVNVIINTNPVLTLTLDGGVISGSSKCFTIGSVIKANSGGALVTYTWYKDGTLITGKTDDSLVPASAGVYSVRITNTGACFDSGFVRIYNDSTPHVSVSPEDVYACPGVIIKLYISPVISGYTYSWQKDGTPLSGAGSYTYDAAIPGTYLVKIKTPNGCEYLSNSVSVSHYPDMTKPVITQKAPNILSVPATYTSYQWYRNSKVIAGANSYNYTYSFDGSYYVQVWDANTCYVYSDTIVLQNLAVNESSVMSGVRVYPNPASDILYISAPQYNALNVQLSDLSGRILIQSPATGSLDIRSLASGMYFLRLTDDLSGNYIGTIKIEKSTR